MGPVGKALGKLQTATLVIAQRGLGDPEEAGAAASDYLRMFGLVAVGYMWCQMAKCARDKQNGDAFYDTKLKTARFYVQKVLPDSAGLFLKIMAGKGTVMAHGRRSSSRASPSLHGRACPGHPRGRPDLARVDEMP